MTDRCDLLIVGGGGAALRAALAAASLVSKEAPPLDIVLVTKGELGQSGVTATACSDRMAFHATLPTTDPGGPEAWRYHAEDIYRIGGEVSDADLATILAREAEAAFNHLDALGVPWVRRPNGSVDQFVTDGSKYARACYTGPYTANDIERALVAALRQTPVRVLERQMVAELLLDPKGSIAGAALVSEEDGRISAWQAKAVVLATGGAGQIYATNVFPPDCTGDGYALAYRAGAELVNLEFIQMGLCSLATGLACSGSMMRALPRIVNDEGEEFLHSRLAEMGRAKDLSSLLFAKGASWPVSYREPSHIIDVLVAAERAAGHRIYLDYSTDPLELAHKALPDAILRWYAREKGVDLLASGAPKSPLERLQAINPPSVRWLEDHGLAITQGERVEIGPAAQHFQGGIKIRRQANTSLPGLYAAGEAAGGQHGANRPGGNALLDGQVFGRIAGRQAARWAMKATIGNIIVDDSMAQEAVAALFASGGASASVLRGQVQAAMDRHCGVRRTTRGLAQLCADLASWQERGVELPTQDLAKGIGTVNILTVARMVAEAAHSRMESRGPHLRFEESAWQRALPRDDERWRRYLVLRQGERGPMISSQRPVRPAADWN